MNRALGFRLALVLAFASLFAVGCSRQPAVEASGEPPAPAADPPPTAVAGDLAITNVTVIDVLAGKANLAQTIVIKGDRIAALGPAATTRAAEGVKTIDGTGKFLIPGLWDSHVHVADKAMPGFFLRYGVTGVRHMFSPFAKLPDRELADPSKGPAPAGPRLIAASQILDGTGTVFRFPFGNNVVKADTPDAARKGVQKLKEMGNDFVKIHSALPRDAYFAALKEAKEQKLAVAGHVPYTVTAGEASDAGQLTIEHLDGVAVLCSAQETSCRGKLCDYAETLKGDPDSHFPWRVELMACEKLDAKKSEALFKKFATNGTWHVPTLVEAQSRARLGDPKALDPEVEKSLPESAKTLWERQFLLDGGVRLSLGGRTFTKNDLRDRQKLLDHEVALVGAMHNAKVRLLAGTDTPGPLIVPGLSLHDELELFVKAGLTPAEALRTATANPAECLKMSDRLGTVEVGKFADLVLLTKDPLADIRNTRAIDTVIIGGRVVPRDKPKK